MSDKRELLVRTALSLFYDRGIHAVGINEVLAQSGVAKKTLYHHFASKDQLIAAAVQLRDQRFIRWFSQALNQTEPGEAALMAMFDALDDWFNERVPALTPFKGCFFINASAEFKGPECAIYNLCQEHKFQVRKLIYPHTLLLTGSDKEAGQLSDQLLLLKEGAIVSAHLMADRQAAVKAKEVAGSLLINFAEKNGHL